MADDKHKYGGQWADQKPIKLKDVLKGTGWEEIPAKWMDKDSPKRAGMKAIDMTMPVDKEIVLKATTEPGEADRGLIVKWRKKGGYEVQYWYTTPDNIVPIGLQADGTSKGKSVKKVSLEYHPDEAIKENKILKLKNLVDEGFFSSGKKGPDAVVSRASNGDFKVSPNLDYMLGKEGGGVKLAKDWIIALGKALDGHELSAKPKWKYSNNAQKTSLFSLIRLWKVVPDAMKEADIPKVPELEKQIEKLGTPSMADKEAGGVF